jgi:hypothetical protein
MDKLQGNDRAKANAKQNPQAGQRCHFPMPPKASFTKISLVLTPRLEPLYSRSIGRKKTFVNPYFSIFS